MDCGARQVRSQWQDRRKGGFHLPHPHRLLSAPSLNRDYLLRGGACGAALLLHTRALSSRSVAQAFRLEGSCLGLRSRVVTPTATFLVVWCCAPCFAFLQGDFSSP